MSKFGENGQIIISLKVSKNYISQVNGYIFGQKCHQWGKFGQNKSFFVKISKFLTIWWPKWPHMSKFGENGQIIFSLKVSKNYFSQFYGHKFDKIYN